MVGWSATFPGKNVIKVCGSMSFALRGGGWVSKFGGKKRYVTLEWPQVSDFVLESLKLLFLNSLKKN